MNTAITTILVCICMLFFAFLIVFLFSRTITRMMKDERWWPYAVGAACTLPVLILFTLLLFPGLFIG